MPRYNRADGRASEVFSDEFRFGPYLLSVPVNPLNSRNTIRVLQPHEPAPTEFSGCEGWIYHLATCIIEAN